MRLFRKKHKKNKSQIDNLLFLQKSVKNTLHPADSERSNKAILQYQCPEPIFRKAGHRMAHLIIRNDPLSIK